MKEQGIPSHRRSSEDIKIPGQGVNVSYRHSINANPNDANHGNFDYVQLVDSSKKVRSRATLVLDTLTSLGISAEALRQAGVIEQSLQTLLAKELSCSRYFRWAFVDNFLEKILQGLILNKQDISQEEINFCRDMIRQVPRGRSLLLHQPCGLRKVYAARGFVLTTEMVLIGAVKAFITVSLSYRLYNWFTISEQNFLEFTTLFNDNTKKGASSLTRLLLSSFDPKWLYLLLASPAIVGALKGLWDTRKSELLTEHATTQLQEIVDYHTNSLPKKSYLWGDVLRQLIPVPGFSSVSERVQNSEQQIRWDGRITNQQRLLLFSNIEKLAFQGNGMSQINAMQSLAKIAHSLSIKDFRRLQATGYPQETLVQILRIKTQALHDLKMLSNHTSVQPEEAQQNPAATLNQSLASTLYATYLLWWLGMSNFKHSPLFWSFKLGKLALEGLFLKGLIESILDVINCPDKQGFKMFFGDFELWANQLTPDCFREFVRQFRLLYKDESFQSFLEQLNSFDLRTIESIDLPGKDLTSNETREILNFLNRRTPMIKNLTLSDNKISDTIGLSFPNSLKYLDLSQNNIGDEGAKELQLPAMLRSLDLSFNNIGSEGVKGLEFPVSLMALNLENNNISTEGTKRLKLPSMLQSLRLGYNNIDGEGVKGLRLPLSLQLLNLRFNNIGNEGAKGLSFPSMLQHLNLRFNDISDEGAKELQLPSTLTNLSLGGNRISVETIKGLQLSLSLINLDLGASNIGDEGIKELRLLALPSLNLLDLTYNNISAEGAKELQLPFTLQTLNLAFNAIDNEGAKRLELPLSLQLLNLSTNGIGDEGTKELRLPSMLTSLSLSHNNISDEGIKGLQIPLALQSLDLSYNNLRDEVTKKLQPLLMLQSLRLSHNNLGDEGVKQLELPLSLQFLDLSANNIGDEGAKELKLSSMITSLSLSDNNISDEGINALLQKIPSINNLKIIFLDGNPYNFTAINLNRIIQKRTLLENCQDALCHANVSLSQQDKHQTSGATKTEPSLFFRWLKMPLDKLSEYASDCITTAFDSLGRRLEKVLSQSPSYFPNIHVIEINDWHSSESMMLHQFKAGGSNPLLLSASQVAIQPILGCITR